MDCYSHEKLPHTTFLLLQSNRHPLKQAGEKKLTQSRDAVVEMETYLCTDNATTVRRLHKVDLIDWGDNFDPAKTHFTQHALNSLTFDWRRLQSKVVVGDIRGWMGGCACLTSKSRNLQCALLQLHVWQNNFLMEHLRASPGEGSGAGVDVWRARFSQEKPGICLNKNS